MNFPPFLLNYYNRILAGDLKNIKEELETIIKQSSNDKLKTLYLIGKHL